MPEFFGTQYVRRAKKFKFEAPNAEKARYFIQASLIQPDIAEKEDGDGDIELKQVGTDEVVDEQLFLQKVQPYIDRAQREDLWVDFLVFNDYYSERWPEASEALDAYKRFVKDYDSVCLQVELYPPSEEGARIDDALILAYGPYSV